MPAAYIEHFIVELSFSWLNMFKSESISLTLKRAGEYPEFLRSPGDILRYPHDHSTILRRLFFELVSCDVAAD